MNRRNPFDALGLPTDPDLTDDQVHAAWRDIAAATHPDRPDGGNLPRYTAASAAYTELSTRWGRTEAYADIIEPLWSITPLPPVPSGPGQARPPLAIRLLFLPDRIWYSHRMPAVLRTLTAAALSFLAGADEPPPRRPADVSGLAPLSVLTARPNLAPPHAADRKDPVPGAASCGSLPTCQARDPRRASPGGQAEP